MTKLLFVNEVARELGVSEAWLRRAEGRVGIPMAKRDVNGWRVYSREDIAALRALLLPTAPGERHHQRCGGQVEEGDGL